jgi:4-hydroxybenzoate polyprenyltransferase
MSQVPVGPERTALTVARAGLKQLRPKQWAKNVLLFAPLIFSTSFTLAAIGDALMAFGAFSLLASSGYILNDFLDREADRKHPRKSARPIASGALPEGLAIVEMIVVLGLGMTLALLVSIQFAVLGVVYLVATILYSFFLKHIVILDVMVLSGFYLLRVIAGAVAIEVVVSEWLFLCTAFLALFLGFHKRRAELVMHGENGGTRKILELYSLPMLDQFQAIVTGAVVLCYALYTVQGAATPWMTVTIPFVAYGIFRYIYLVDQKGQGDAPDETLLKDLPILATGILYGITAVAVLLADQAGWLPAVFMTRGGG